MKYSFFIILFIFAFHLLVSSAFSQSKSAIKDAQKLYQQRRYKEAFWKYQDFIKESPTNPEWQRWAGLSLLNSGFSERSLPYLQKSIELSKTPSEELWYAYAQSLHLNNKFLEAIEAYQKSDESKKKRSVIAKRIEECNAGIAFTSRPVNATINSLGNGINTVNDEYLPVVTADESMLFFTSRRRGTTGGKTAEDGKPYEDIYFSRNSFGSWSGATQMPSPINTADNDAVIGLSADGKMMFLYRGRNGGDIYIAELEKGEWQKPYPFEYNTPALETSCCLSADGKQFFFVSDRGGNKDIYICRKSISGKTWMAPQKMNGNINTLYDEESPFLHADGLTLFFSSKGHNSMGGYDIFYTKLNPKGVFDNAQNIGYPINTAADDLYLSVTADGKKGYFSSENSKGLGGQDIYVISLPPAIVTPVTLIAGKVVSEKTKQTIKAKITVTNNEDSGIISETESDENDGSFLLSLPSGKNYAITVEKKGLLFFSDNVDRKIAEGYQKLDKEIALPSIEKGAKITLRNLFFDVNSNTLRANSFPELDRVVELLKQNPALKVELAGHTDNSGTEEFNKTLSTKRAEAVQAYLQGKGIASSRMQAKGYSSTKPIASNENAAGKQLNRRTELVILNTK